MELASVESEEEYHEVMKQINAFGKIYTQSTHNYLLLQVNRFNPYIMKISWIINTKCSLQQSKQIFVLTVFKSPILKYSEYYVIYECYL